MHNRLLSPRQKCLKKQQQQQQPGNCWEIERAILIFATMSWWFNHKRANERTNARAHTNANELEIVHNGFCAACCIQRISLHLIYSYCLSVYLAPFLLVVRYSLVAVHPVSVRVSFHSFLLLICFRRLTLYNFCSPARCLEFHFFSSYFNSSSSAPPGISSASRGLSSASLASPQPPLPSSRSLPSRPCYVLHFSHTNEFHSPCFTPPLPIHPLTANWRGMCFLSCRLF